MFSCVSVVSVLALSLLAAATPAPLADKRWATPTTTPAVTTTVTVTAVSTPTSVSSCSTGPVQCCNSVESSSAPAVSTLLGLLGVVLEGVIADVGLTCSPITVVGVGSGSCSSNVVCCENNSFGGLISIGCVPIIL